MKRRFYTIVSSVLALSALCFTGCVKEMPGGPDREIKVKAALSETKTAIDGYSTVWTAGDEMAAVYYDAGATSFTNKTNVKFTLTDAASGTFSASASVPEGGHDWYFLYPYSSSFNNPKKASKAITFVPYGQAQRGKDSKAHISGKNDPLVGVAKSVAGNEISVSMKHLSSMVKVVVTNTSGSDFTVSNITLEAPGHKLSGNFFVDLTGEDGFVCTPASTIVNESVRLSLQKIGGDAIHSGSSATFYMTVMPFEAKAGEKLVLTVNDYTKEITLSDDVEFKSGKVRTLTFDMDRAVVPVSDHDLGYLQLIEHTASFTFDNLTSVGKSSESPSSPDKLEVTWDEVNQGVLDVLGISFEQFNQKYSVACPMGIDPRTISEVGYPGQQVNPEDTYDYELLDDVVNGIPGLSYEAVSPEEWMTSTNIIKFLVDNNIQAPLDTVIRVIYKAKDNRTDYNVAMNFHIIVSAPLPHVHDFIIEDFVLNPDYILGTQDKLNFTRPVDLYARPEDYNTYGGVCIKGTSAGMNSGLVEHFKQYLADLVNPTTKKIDSLEEGTILRFQILNFSTSEVNWTVNSNYSYGIVELDNYGDPVKVAGTGIECAYVEFTKEQIEDIVNFKVVCPEIYLIGAAIDTDRDVLIEVTETCPNTKAQPRVKKGYYYVVFYSATIKVQPVAIELKTFKEKPDTAWVYDHIQILDAENDEPLFVWDATNKKWAPTEAANAYEGLATASVEASFQEFKYYTTPNPYTGEPDSFKSFGSGTLLQIKSSEAEKMDILEWYNMGTDLQNEKFCVVVVSYNIANGRFKGTVDVPVTVLSTEHSK